jgi:hypothetical protein
MFVSSTAAWAPFEASQQGCGEFQSQRGDGICYMTLLTQGRPGAGSSAKIPRDTNERRNAARLAPPDGC